MYNCDICSKTYRQRQSLWRHKQNCQRQHQKTSKPQVGQGIMHVPIPSQLVMPTTKSRIRSSRKYKELVKKMNEDEDDQPSPRPLTLAAERAIKEVNRMENEGELSASPPLSFQDCSSSDDEEMLSEDEDDDDGLLWEQLAIKAHNRDWTIFKCLDVYLHVYYNLENDYVYQKIMGDIDDAITFPLALDNAIDENRDIIVNAVAKCRQKQEENEILNIFGGISRVQVVQDGCKWFTGSSCYCSECKGRSLFNVFRSFALIFHAMESDDVIEKIITAVRQIGPDDVDLEDAIRQEMDENKEEIQEKYDVALARLKECGAAQLK